MSERILPFGSDADDLPRTLRRERDAREREAREARERDARETREREAQERTKNMAPHRDWPDSPQPAVVTALNIPFFRLMLFSLKAVVAAIPALALLCVILWAGMLVLKSQYPDLIHTRIYIDFNPPSAATAKTPAAVTPKNPNARGL